MKKVLVEALIPKVKNPDLLENFVTDSFDYGKIQIITQMKWILDFFKVADQIIYEGVCDDEKNAIFWVRLHGIIVEVHKEAENRAISYKNFSEYIEKDRTLEIYYELHKKLFLLLDLLKTRFTYEDLVFLDNARQSQCHVNQKHYRLRIQGKKVLDTYTPSTTRKKEKIQKIDDILATKLSFFKGRSSEDWETMAVMYYYDKIKDLHVKICDESRYIKALTQLMR